MMVIFMIYILDADNNVSTGLLTGEIPDGAYEVLLEGTIFDDWLNVLFYRQRSAEFWNYTSQSISEFYKVGTCEARMVVFKI